MKILVIGNGFDLAHYLPTSYHHFMRVMLAVENLPLEQKKVGFNDLFGEWTKKSEGWFFRRMNELYETKDIKLENEVIQSIKLELKANSWYRYFQNHLTNENASWIDFETKIGEALESFSLIHARFETYKNEVGALPYLRLSGSDPNFKKLFKSTKFLDLLQCFGLLTVQFFSEHIQHSDLKPQIETITFNSEFFDEYKGDFEFSFSKLLFSLQKELHDFTEIFNIYLCEVVSKFKPKSKFKALELFDPNLKTVYSFNYTSTYKFLYSDEADQVSVEFLHGKAEKPSSGLVLGIDEFPNEELKATKAYGFVKYHQKLIKNTDYLFLSENNAVTKIQTSRLSVMADKRPSLEIYLWGHSLDVSDKNYIHEIFLLNDKEYQGKESYQGRTTVIVFFHTDSSRFSMLSNLIHILDKDIVERWMKKGWLKFQPAPDIYQLNS